MSIGVSLLFSSIIYFGFHVYNYVLIPICGKFVSRRIENHAPPTAKLDRLDNIFITFNKLVTIMFIYHCYLFVMSSGINIDISSDALLAALPTVPLHLILYFVIYDFWYTLFHWALHWPPLYPLVHKHHHKQPSPFRGNLDAINVHPFEYVTGEYNHLWTVFQVTLLLGAKNVHALSFFIFIIIGGFMASLNHTRVDLRIPYLYNVIAHDIHHAIQPRANYGQYTMLWDSFFGTYLPTDEALRQAPKTNGSKTTEAPKKTQ